MRLLIATILLLLNQALFGQLQTDIKNVLTGKNLQTLDKYIDELVVNSKSHIKYYWEVEREIVRGFQEKILMIEKSVPDKKDPNISTVYIFKVNLLSTGRTILFYDLMERKSKKVNNQWVDYYPTIDRYENDTLIKKLETVFFASFGGQLQRQELFIDSIVYGERCSDAGIDPPKKMHLDFLVALKDIANLLKWLQSTNVETQLYAVEGFYALKQNGYTIKENELLGIKNILKRKGTVRTCSGCIYSQREIGEIAKKFKF